MNQSRFIEELQKLNIEITDKQLKDLETYYEMLIEYNKKMNLTGITEKEQVYLKHFYDSLTIIKIIDLNEQEKESIKKYNQGEALLVCGSRRMRVDVILTEAELDSFGSGGGL